MCAPRAISAVRHPPGTPSPKKIKRHTDLRKKGRPAPATPRRAVGGGPIAYTPVMGRVCAGDRVGRAGGAKKKRSLSTQASPSLLPSSRPPPISPPPANAPPPHSLALSLLGLTPNNDQARLGQAGVPVGRGRAHQQPPKPKAKQAISRVCLILPCTKALVHPFSSRRLSPRRRTGARTNSSPFTTNFQRCASTKPSIQFLKLAPLGRQPPPLFE